MEISFFKRYNSTNYFTLSKFRLQNMIKTCQKSQDVSFDSETNILKINTLRLKITPSKDNCIMGLNEAFSCFPSNGSEFIGAYNVYHKIVESNTEDPYNEIARQIIKDIDSSQKNEDFLNELKDLISILCPNAQIQIINNSINEFGGMLNYIIPNMFEKKLLAPQDKEIEIKNHFITAGLLLYYNENINSQLIKTTPFSICKRDQDGKIKLTRIARKRLISSYFPCIVLLFGSLRTGKSTLASHLAGGPKSNNGKTLFKTAGSAKACTRLINGFGPMKCKELSFMHLIEQNDKNNPNLERDIFIIDSEGLNALNEETAWLKQALLAMLAVNTISFYVANSININDLDQFMKYLRFETVIGGKKIEHGLGYINNKENFDGSNVIEQANEQNKEKTAEIIEKFSKTSISVDDSHFKCISVLSFHSHANEYFASLSKVAKFIVERCLNEGTLMTGEMFVETYEEFASKINGITDSDDSNKLFETIFYEVLKNSMQRSIEKQIPVIQNQISQKLLLLPLQELNLLDINNFITNLKESGIIKSVINKAVSETLPEIPDSFPFIIDASTTNLLNTIDNITKNERIKLLSMQANEVYDLGHGFSFSDGNFKRKIFDLNYSNQLTNINLNSNTSSSYHLPEHVIIEHVPATYQKHSVNMSSRLDKYVSYFDSKFKNNSSFKFNASEIDYQHACNTTKNLMGLSYASNSPNMNVSVSINVDSLAQIHFDRNVDLKQYICPQLKTKFDELDIMLSNKDIKSPEIKSIVSEVFSEYGELVAIGFFIGNYKIVIAHKDKLNLESGGSIAFSSSKNGSDGINIAGIELGNSESNEHNENNSNHSQIISSSQTNTTITYGSPDHPATFMFDIIEDSRFGSSFVPLFKYASSQRVMKALEYWTGRWDIKPKSLSEYKNVNDLDALPFGQKITLYHNNRPYTVFINQSGKIVIPDSQIKYYSIYEYKRDKGGNDFLNEQQTFDVILDPATMTISGFNVTPYVKRWKDNLGHHNRGYGYKRIHLEINLSPFWEFDQPINDAYFKGSALTYMRLNYIDSHSFKIEFNCDNKGYGKSWSFGPYYLELQQNLKVRFI